MARLEDVELPRFPRKGVEVLMDDLRRIPGVISISIRGTLGADYEILMGVDPPDPTIFQPYLPEVTIEILSTDGSAEIEVLQKVLAVLSASLL